MDNFNEALWQQSCNLKNHVRFIRSVLKDEAHDAAFLRQTLREVGRKIALVAFELDGMAGKPGEDANGFADCPLPGVE